MKLLWHQVIETRSFAEQIAKVPIAEQPIKEEKTMSESTQELHEQVYRLRAFTHELLMNPKFCHHWPLVTTQNEWTIKKYIMEVSKVFQYWTMWMSKSNMVTLYHIETVYNDTFDPMDGVIQALPTKKSKGKKYLYIAVMFPQQQLSMYPAEVTPITVMLLISLHIYDPF